MVNGTVYDSISCTLAALDHHRMWGPRPCFCVQLVHIAPVTIIYGTEITIVFMGFIDQFMTTGAWIIIVTSFIFLDNQRKLDI